MPEAIPPIPKDIEPWEGRDDPAKALEAGPLAELTGKYGNIKTLVGLPDPLLTEPSIIF